MEEMDIIEIMKKKNFAIAIIYDMRLIMNVMSVIDTSIAKAF